MTKTMQTALLTAVNAPYQVYLDADALACAITKGQIATGQVGSFFTETSVESQKSFAAAYGIASNLLSQTASDFANWSGQPVALGA